MMVSHTHAAQPDSWFSLSGSETDVVLSSRIRLERNIGGVVFLHRMSNTQIVDLRKRLEHAFSAMDEEFFLIDGEALQPDLQRFYQERGILEAGDLPPIAFVSRSEDVIVRIGPVEHVTQDTFAGGLDIAGAFERAALLDGRLEEALSFAVNLQQGYLSANVDTAGSGVTASVMVHLPGLSRSGGLAFVAADLSREHVSLRGFGDGEFSVAHLFTASVHGEAGKSETDIISELEGYTQALVHYERAARGDLLTDFREDVREAAFRALGTLRYVRSLSLEESLDLLTLVRLALASGESMNGLTLGRIDPLLFLVQPAQVEALYRERGTTHETEDEKRAAFVRETMEYALAQGD